MSQTKQRAWRMKQFQREVPLSNSQLFEFIGDGTLPSVKIGGARFITISPEDFIERHREPKPAA